MASPIKFTEDVRERYLGMLRTGTLKFAAAKRVGVGYRTVQRYRAADPEFKELEELAMLEAVEGIEAVVYELGMAGDLKAAEMWLKAHRSSVYGAKAQIVVDATDNAVEMSRNEAIARVAAAQSQIEARRAAIEEVTDVIDVESSES